MQCWENGICRDGQSCGPGTTVGLLSIGSAYRGLLFRLTLDNLKCDRTSLCGSGIEEGPGIRQMLHGHI
jgi:hypothetical protein